MDEAFIQKELEVEQNFGRLTLWMWVKDSQFAAKLSSYLHKGWGIVEIVSH